MRFIGDIHGDILNYMPIIGDATESVQIGDFGVGFLPEYDLMDSMHADGRHKFIRGNHDDPALCKERPGYIEDGTVDTERSMMYVGGAWSIDWAYRLQRMGEGWPTCWWADEELSPTELTRIHALYAHNRPRIMVTHDAPTSVAYDMFIGPFGRKQIKTRTAETFDEMFRLHQPEIWLFGHWHEDRDVNINGTRFICLGINSYTDLEV